MTALIEILPLALSVVLIAAALIAGLRTKGEDE